MGADAPELLSMLPPELAPVLEYEAVPAPAAHTDATISGLPWSMQRPSLSVAAMLEPRVRHMHNAPLHTVIRQA